MIILECNAVIKRLYKLFLPNILRRHAILCVHASSQL